MNVTDPIADLLTRIRNAQVVRHSSVKMPGCKQALAVAKVLERSGYVGAVSWQDEGPQGTLSVTLKYTSEGQPVIRGLRRESTPGQRRYVKKKDIPTVLNGLGISILSTSQGVLTGEEAKKASAGGELMASVW